MKDALTMANINLYAILRNLEDLCEIDEEVKSLIQDKDISMQFIIRGGPQALIKFKNGKCTFTRGRGKNNVKLYFTSPEHFNQMILGNKNPIPLKGLTKMKFLTNEFVKMTDKLTYYLTPNETLLEDPTYFKRNTILTFYTALFALVEIGNNDKIGKLNASRIPDGQIQVLVNEGPSINLTVQKGNLNGKKGHVDRPRAFMIFNSIQTANDMLNGKVDSYTCISSGNLQMKGFIPMLDNTDKLLGQVSYYLK